MYRNACRIINSLPVPSPTLQITAKRKSVVYFHEQTQERWIKQDWKKKTLPESTQSQIQSEADLCCMLLLANKANIHILR